MSKFLSSVDLFCISLKKHLRRLKISLVFVDEKLKFMSNRISSCRRLERGSLVFVNVSVEQLFSFRPFLPLVRSSIFFRFSRLLFFYYNPTRIHTIVVARTERDRSHEVKLSRVHRSMLYLCCVCNSSSFNRGRQSSKNSLLFCSFVCTPNEYSACN